MEKVADVLHRKYPQFNTILPTRSIHDALYQMCCENVEYLIVMDEQEKFMGILSEHDITSKVLLNGKELEAAMIKDFMTSNLPIATVDNSLEYAMQLMEHHNSKFVVVYDEFRFKGILTIQDIVKQALSKRQHIFEEVQPQRQGYPWNY